MKKDDHRQQSKMNLKTILNNYSFIKRQNEKLIPSIQLGINDFLNSNLNEMGLRPVIKYMKADTNILQQFDFYAYSPNIFDSLRNIFGINRDKYISSLCDKSLIEFSNPGASGSQLYITDDNKFIVKTIKSDENSCLLELISKYHFHFRVHVTSLLPKFSGFYGIRVPLFSEPVFRVVTMNNLLPSNIQINEKFDLKGSTLGRTASETEKKKKLPTFKDLDFKKMYPMGILLENKIYNHLLEILINDCKLLQSLKIMDYSLLMGIFNIDSNLNENKNKALMEAAENKWNRETKKFAKNIIYIADNSENEYDVSFGDCIPATNQNGERLLLFVGIIDVLQTFEMMKILEYKAKSLTLSLNLSSKENSESFSVQPADTYAERFITFIRKYVK